MEKKLNRDEILDRRSIFMHWKQRMEEAGLKRCLPHHEPRALFEGICGSCLLEFSVGDGW